MERGTAKRLYDFYEKEKNGYYITKDVYTKRGMLLIRKGQRVSPKVIAKLIKLKNHDIDILDDSYDISSIVVVGDNQQNDVFSSDDKQREVFTPTALNKDIFTFNAELKSLIDSITKKFGEKMNVKDPFILEKPSKVLCNIIFESKNKPWWIYVNALANYVGWIYTHSIDVAIMCIMMAENLGYGDEKLYNIGFSSLLHDAGKLLVPKSILEKDGELTDMERTFVRQHCELGACSLGEFNIPKEYMDIITQHHERLDGSGYPNGLKEDEIGMNAKIAMVADAVDAITSYRPYREAQAMDVAMKMLREEKEKYPQDIVSLLEDILKQE